VVRPLADGVAAARRAGLSRKVRSALVAMPGRNLIWRAEQAMIREDEVAPLRALLARVESGEVRPLERKSAAPKRAGRAELEAKLDAVAKLLHAEWRAVKPVSFRDALAELVGAPRPQEEARS
jgi:hypothetical protein